MIWNADNILKTLYIMNGTGKKVDNTIKINLADTIIQIEWCHSVNMDRCRAFQVESSRKADVKVSWMDIDRKEIPEDSIRTDPLCEFQYILIPISDRLLGHGRCIVHGTAISWNGTGYMFMAPSGTGKTTQYIQWRKRYPSEVHILNGDKPILRRMPDGSFRIYPSPWRGKEGWGKMETAPLGGIIYLEQGPGNHAVRIDASDISVRIFQELFYSADNAELVREALDFTRDLIGQVPIWKLINRGDTESAELMHDLLIKEGSR